MRGVEGGGRRKEGDKEDEKAKVGEGEGELKKMLLVWVFLLLYELKHSCHD